MAFLTTNFGLALIEMSRKRCYISSLKCLWVIPSACVSSVDVILVICCFNLEEKETCFGVDNPQSLYENNPET